MSTDHDASIEEKFRVLSEALNEAQTRLWAAVEARSLGRGGVTAVARATGLSRSTITLGLRELDDPSHHARLAVGRVRRPGGGRKPITVTQPGVIEVLEDLVAPATRGDPMSSLLWTSKSTAKLATELQLQGFQADASTVADLLKAQGYSLQAARKTKEGGDHPDRDAQFRHIAAEVTRMQADQQPVISVDCKKKELIGEFKNAGREWQLVGQPEGVNVYDFPDMADGKAIPYGVYDVTHNEGWVSVGIDHDTAEFAVATIRQWWQQMGKKRYAQATSLLITADGGGSNGSRNRLWKQEVQRLADDIGRTIHVSHLPPGTSKWNKIEHRLFGQITINWRGKPLRSLETVVGLIAGTTTTTGLKVRAAADQKQYPTGRKISDEEVEALAITRSDFHGEWNYSFTPRKKGG
jgi:DNA-binding phage protein